MGVGERGSEQGGVMRLIYSSDHGKTWEMGNKIDYSPMIGAWTWTGEQILELDDGTVLVPISGYFSTEETKGGWLSSGVVRSSDNGATWSLSVIGRAEPDKKIYYSEPSVAKLDDGTLVALLRPNLPQSVSTDGGKTWSSPVATGLKGTHCSLIQLPDGVLLCGYHRPPQLALSADNGKTWYANLLWKMEEPLANWGWYSSVEVVDENTAVALINDIPRFHIVRSCLLRRQPTAKAKGDQQPWKKPGNRKGQEIVGPDGGTLVWVPGGKFMMGSNDGEIDEKPVHEVQLDGFWIGKFEVSNALYRDYWREKGRTFRPDNSRGENHPVVYVTWQDVVDYCKHYGLSLPTEAQWEYAARGPQSLRYPWGNEWDTLKCCHDDNRGPGDRTFRGVGLWTWRGTCGSGVLIGMGKITTRRHRAKIHRAQKMASPTSCAATRGGATSTLTARRAATTSSLINGWRDGQTGPAATADFGSS